MLILLAIIAHETLPARIQGWWPFPGSPSIGPAGSTGEAVSGEIATSTAAEDGAAAAAPEQDRRASELDPDDPLVLYRRAEALEQLGELERALATYRRAAALSLRARPGIDD